MRTSEYLDAAQQAMGIRSDYELARRLSISKQRISAYRTGKEWPDNYTVIRLAIALNLDPVAVLADLESQREKRPERAEFWRGFSLRAGLLAVLLGTLQLSGTAISPRGVEPTSGVPGNPHDAVLRIICDYVYGKLSDAGKRLRKIMDEMGNGWQACSAV